MISQPLAAGHPTRPSIKSWTPSSRLIDGASVRFGVELNQSIDRSVCCNDADEAKPKHNNMVGPVGPQDDEARKRETASPLFLSETTGLSRRAILLAGVVAVWPASTTRLLSSSPSRSDDRPTTPRPCRVTPPAAAARSSFRNRVRAGRAGAFLFVVGFFCIVWFSDRLLGIVQEASTRRFWATSTPATACFVKIARARTPPGRRTSQETR